jgi:hypothetical protein
MQGLRRCSSDPADDENDEAVLVSLMQTGISRWLFIPGFDVDL